MNPLSLWLLLLLVLSRLPVAFRAANCAFLGHLDPETSGSLSASEVFHIPSSSVSLRVCDELVVAENNNTGLNDVLDNFGESNFILVINICH